MIRQPKRVWSVTNQAAYLDGHIETLKGTPLRKNVAARIGYRAIPAKGQISHILASQQDARTWIDECQIGGNLSRFMHELRQRSR